MSTHTVIVAQSGSGKSFFLGRLIEELILQTRARCLILDSNADFRRIHEVQAQPHWTNAHYELKAGTGWLPTERMRHNFVGPWSKLSIRVLRGDLLPQQMPRYPYERVQIWWPSLLTDFLADELDTLMRAELFHIHTFVKHIQRLSRMEQQTIHLSHQRSFINTAENVYAKINRKTPDLQSAACAAVEHEFKELLNALRTKRKKMDMSLFKHSVERAGASVRYVTEDVERFYFGRAREYESRGILATQLSTTPLSIEKSIIVLDIPSLLAAGFDRAATYLIVSTILTTEQQNARARWSEAMQKQTDQLDTRIPTFIVVDEAHNWLPADPQSRFEIAIRDQFRTIAAEGRKYGLFLILASQRPDKLDPFVLSECENKALMRLNSEVLLNAVRKSLGLDDIPPTLLEQCRRLANGRVLIAGHWSPEGQLLYSAARRTAEGGRNLNPKYWASSGKLVGA